MDDRFNAVLEGCFGDIARQLAKKPVVELNPRRSVPLPAGEGPDIQPPGERKRRQPAPQKAAGARNEDQSDILTPSDPCSPLKSNGMADPALSVRTVPFRTNG